MIKVTIEDKNYEVPNSIDDLNVYKWIEACKVVQRREVKVLGKTRGGEEVTTEVEIGMESEEWLIQRDKDLIHVLTGIPYDMLELSYQLNQFLVGTLVNSLEDPSKRPVNTTPYHLVPIHSFTFSQFADFENYKKMGMVEAFATVLMNVTIKKDSDGKEVKTVEEYNRSHPLFNRKVAVINNSPAKGFVKLMMDYNALMQEYKDSYPYVFQSFGSSEPSPDLDAHSEKFGWEEVIRSLAEGPAVFNSPHGTLHAVRNAHFNDVLSYLNVKKAHSLAESADYKRKTSKSKRTNS